MRRPTLRAIIAATFLTACAAEAPVAPALPSPRLAAEHVVATTRLLNLRTVDQVAARSEFIVLTAKDTGATRTWSSAFRLVCSDCAFALSVFGYTVQDATFAPTYQSLDSLFADNEVPEHLHQSVVDLPLEAGTSEPAALAAFRVVDASDAADPHYLVRLRAAPDTLFATRCESVLRVLRGSLSTTPINKALLAHWNVANPPLIGCAAVTGRLLPAPSAAEPVVRERPFVAIDEVWRVTHPPPGVTAGTYPYVVTRDATGARRGFVLACGAEAGSALRALGLDASDIRAAPASDAELRATGFGAQPTIFCGGLGGTEILALSSPNDTSKALRFRFGNQHDLIEFSCQESEAHWRGQQRARLELPHQALAHLGEFEGRGETRTLTMGCRCTGLPPGAEGKIGNRALAPGAASVTPPPTLGHSDVVAVAMSDTATKATELHVLSRSSAYQRFSLHVATPLAATDTTTWAFAMGEHDRDGIPDLFVLKRKATGSRSTEVHVLSGASNYRTFILQTGTLLEETPDAHWSFAMGDLNRDGVSDLFAFKRAVTGTHSTEVHVLSGAAGFLTWLMHTGTPLEETPGAHWSLSVGELDRDGVPDVIAVKRANTGTHSTEVHVLSGASRYQTWIRHTGTPLEETPNDDVAFLTGDADADGLSDLLVVKRTRTGTTSTEIHVLSGASGYRDWIITTGTPLATTPCPNWTFVSR